MASSKTLLKKKFFISLVFAGKLGKSNFAAVYLSNFDHK